MQNILKKLIYVSVIFALSFSTSIPSVTAQNEFPGRPERISKADISLSEVENYYGLLSEKTGPIKVVVELSDSSAVEYQASGNGLSAAQSQMQINRIQQAQGDFLQNAKNAGIDVNEIYRVQRVYNGVALIVDSQQLKMLSELDGVKAVYPLISKTLDHTTSVPLINALQVWGGTAEYQGDNVKVGIIDTGIDYLHKNFGGSGSGYDTYDFTQNVANDGFPSVKVVGGFDFAGDDYDAEGEFGSVIPSPDPDPMDCNGHGSHVAGSAAGMGVLPDGTTFTGDYATLKDLDPLDYIDLFRIGPGVAPKADLYALRVFGCDGSTDLTDLAVEWAVDPNGDGDFSDHLDVINLSLGSSFGSEYDSSSMAVNNAVLAGVIVVASAGNSGDVNYIGGAPGVARNVISVANSIDASSVLGGFIVNSPALIAGVYPATEATWGPDLDVIGPVTGDLVLAENLWASIPSNNGCAAFTNATAVNGKIALVDRGVCNFSDKAKNAQLAGAIGVLIANNSAGDPITMGGSDPTVTIPAQMTTQAVGNTLKANLGSTVSVTLTAAYRDEIMNVDPSQNDKLVSSSSRGIRRGDNGLKPDISAPGNTIYSTATGTGDQGTSFGGTSMASPHVAGVMALLRQEHPDWSVEELKARVMNTATHDLFVGDSHSGNKYTPSRIGAGRVDVLNASAADQVIAFNKTDPGAVSVSFGFIEVVEEVVGADMTLTKTVTVENKGAVEASYNAAIDLSESYQANTGVEFSLLDAAGAALANPVVIPAGGSVDLQVKLALDSSLLQRKRDLTMKAANLYSAGRHYITETGGYLTLTPNVAQHQLLRLPVHAAPRPASDVASTFQQLPLPDAQSGTVTLPLSGPRVDLIDDVNWTSVFELMATSPNDDWSVGINNNADLQHVGVMADTPLYADFADVSVYFGLSMYGEWSTPAEVEFDIYIDADEDGVPDALVVNVDSSIFTGTIEDSFVSMFCPYPITNLVAECDFWYWVNAYSGSVNTNVYNSSVMMLPVSAEGIGLSESNTDFNFSVVTYNRETDDAVDETDWLSYDVGQMALDTNDYTDSEMPIWALPFGSEIQVNYDKTNLAEGTLPNGLLLLHHHNTTGKQAEVVGFEFAEQATLTPTDDKVNGLSGNQVVIDLILNNPTVQNCTFDMTYVSPLGWDIVAPSVRYLPAGAQDIITVRVNIPASATFGQVETVDAMATCREDGSITASTSFQIEVGVKLFMPIVTR